MGLGCRARYEAAAYCVLPEQQLKPEAKPRGVRNLYNRFPKVFAMSAAYLVVLLGHGLESILTE